ncbi:hypothetical protein BDV96DRAFT_594423 [Lophiotrema nucula]|uniref:Heme haloperoxidase family profile domain-containing protein n=1 Tax=Lophiotrema nucula TaxID=690887 RepID=A0A6A5ZQE4_9PLEO|nr:hypothetical protein BDV96DRAFT_594423 [Lophiotrema nucula]
MRFSAFLVAVVAVLATPFDPKTQHIDVSGDQKFIAAGPDDHRGPCPGLNVLANHGFIPRNGTATIEQLINASVGVFDLTYLKIGDKKPVIKSPPQYDPPQSKVKTKIPPQTLDFPHTAFEVDASPTRPDKPEAAGNGNDLYLPYFQQLLDLQKASPMTWLTSASKFLPTIDSSDTRNPLRRTLATSCSRFGGVVLNGNVFSLIFQMMANRSTEYPEGCLDRSTLMSFYGVEESQYGRLKYYRRPVNDLYDGLKTNHDLIHAARYPELVSKYSLGETVNGVKTHQAIDIEKLTNGTYKPSTIKDGHNLTCLGLLGGATLPPTWLRNFYEDYDNSDAAKLMARLTPFFAQLKCPQLSAPFEQKYFEAFPGYKSSFELPGAFK